MDHYRGAPRQGLTTPASSKFPDLTLHDLLTEAFA